MITHTKVVETLSNWKLENEKVTDIYEEATGKKKDHSYYVGEDYVLKFYSNVGLLKRHIAIAKSLEKIGALSAVAIHTKNDNAFVWDGEFYACLTKRIKGSPIKSSELYAGDYKWKARCIGESLGQLHLLLREFDIPVKENDLLSKIKDWALPEIKERLELENKFLDRYIAELEELFPALQKQIIHRDPHPGNIIRDGNRFAFIDFDLTERNVRIYDICYASAAILSETVNTLQSETVHQWIEMYKHIVWGYDAIANLSEKERKAIPYILLGNQFICTAWFGKQKKCEEQYQSNIKMTKWMIEQFEKLRI